MIRDSKLVKSGSAFQAAITAPKVAASYIYYYWCATADGKRFLIPTPVAESTPPLFAVVLNWTALLKK